jgi:UDP-glucose 4-epimerase
VYAPEARLVTSSTGNVYNANATRPALEADAVSPTAAYAAGKVAAEQLLRDSGLT